MVQVGRNLTDAVVSFMGAHTEPTVERDAIAHAQAPYVPFTRDSRRPLKFRRESGVVLGAPRISDGANDVLHR